MPIDREQSLKRAEKLLRQGRIDAAIAEYGQIVAEFPKDFSTANLLGDLLVRAGQVIAASDQYGRVAEHLAEAGFAAKASALYKKIIKLNPTNETALLRAAELAASLGLTADVRGFMTPLFQLRLKRGDRPGAVEIARRRAALDPSDVVGRLDAARMLVEAGAHGDATDELRTAGLALEAQGRLPEAIRVMREALRIGPDDRDTRDVLVRLLVDEGDFAGAGELAQSAEQLQALADRCRERGKHDEARAALERLVALAPGPSGARVELAQYCLGVGDTDGAVRWAAVEGVTEWPPLALALANAYLRLGRIDEGQTLLAEAVSRDASLVAQVAGLVTALLPLDQDAAAAALLVAVDADMEREDASQANARVLAFVADAPDVLGVLRRHIDVCVDGGLSDELPAAQLRLADALLQRGSWQEARFIAEDLVAAAPDDPRYCDRLAQAIEHLGAGEAESMADETASADAPADEVPAGGDDATRDDDSDGAAVSDDFSALLASLAGESAADEAPGQDAPPATAELEAQEPDEPGSAPPRHAPPGGLPLVNDSVRRLFEDEQPPSQPPTKPGPDAAVEIDLSGELVDLGAPGGERTTAPPEPAEALSLGEHFRGLRERAPRLSAEQLLARGATERAAGEHDQAVATFREAARQPDARVRASRAIAAISRERGENGTAIEWLERAAETPDVSGDELAAVLAELGEALLNDGERVRALAVFLELQATGREYPGVAARIAELEAELAAEEGERA